MDKHVKCIKLEPFYPYNKDENFFSKKKKKRGMRIFFWKPQGWEFNRSGMGVRDGALPYCPIHPQTLISWCSYVAERVKCSKGNNEWICVLD